MWVPGIFRNCAISSPRRDASASINLRHCSAWASGTPMVELFVSPTRGSGPNLGRDVLTDQILQHS
jgi:hypothetical protein